MSAWAAISGTAKNIWTGISNFFTSTWSGVKSKVSGILSTIKTGFDNAASFVKNLASSAYTWGADIIEGIVNGIKSCIGKVKDAVTSVADTIRSFLHFSVPDEGPLTDYESWMPDFMSGLAEGIEKSRGMIAKAVEGVAGDMVICPRVNAPDVALAGGGAFKRSDLSELTNAIRETMAVNKGAEGNIVISVYIGGTLLDEMVVNAQQRTNLRGGGR